MGFEQSFFNRLKDKSLQKMAPSTPGGGASSTTPINHQAIDAGPRGAANLEVMCALSTGKKNTLRFFKGDDDATPIGEHTIYDIAGEQQDVGMVQAWNQRKERWLTSGGISVGEASRAPASEPRGGTEWAS